MPFAQQLFKQKENRFGAADDASECDFKKRRFFFWHLKDDVEAVKVAL